MKIKEVFLFSFALMLVAICAGARLSAASDEQISKDVLQNLAKRFVHTVKEGYSQADKFMNNGTGSKEGEYINYIPDGSELIFNVRLGKLLLADDIFSFTEGGKLYLSMQDFFTGVGFKIKVNSENGIADGWYIRENNRFSFDLDNKTANVNGKIYDILDDAYRIRDGDIYILSDTLAQWFDMEIAPEYSSLYLSIKSERKLPIQEKKERRKRGKPARGELPPVKQPRVKEGYKMVDIPNIDVSLGTNYNKYSREAKARMVSKYSVSSGGDLLGMTNHSYIYGDNVNGMSDVRTNFSKFSEDSNLLGELKAKKIEFGDLTPVRQDLLINTSQEFGARVTNKDKNLNDNRTTTYFEGYLPQDWDVELYRNETLVDFVTVGDDGYYKFDDVPLYIGDNNFKIVFYGPQGEIREEYKNIPVTIDTISDAKGLYDVSLTMANRQTYRKNRAVKEEDNKPHFSAVYETTINGKQHIKAGIKSIPKDLDRENFITGGFTTNLGNSLIDVNAAYDLKGEAGIELLGRHNFGEHRFKGKVNLATDSFLEKLGNSNSNILGVDTAVRGPLYKNKEFNSNYQVDATYRKYSNGNDRKEIAGVVSARVKGTSFTDTLKYDQRNGIESDYERVRNIFSVKGHNFDVDWRASAEYELSPESTLRSLYIDANKQFIPGLKGRAEIEHNPSVDYTEGTLSVNWTTEHAIYSPRIVKDNTGRTQASMNVRFGTSVEPYSGAVKTSGKPLIYRGGVSAFVYLDKDGNRIFNEGDMPLKNVSIKSIHTRRDAFTNEDGIAFIKDLPVDYATDIVIEPGSFEDPFWISSKEGYSVVPRAGVITKLEFPVHMSGEIDGVIYKKRNDESLKEVKGIKLHLYNRNGDKVKTSAAAYDGFYVFSQIPPGQYYLVVDKEDADYLKLARPLPKEIIVGYEGTIHYGVDLVLSDDVDVDFDFSPDIDEFRQKNANILFPNIKGKSVILNLGEYNSNVLMAVVWHKIRTRYHDILGDALPLVKPSQSVSYGDEGHVLRVVPETDDLSEVIRQCRALIGRNIYCKMEFLPMDNKIADSKI